MVIDDKRSVEQFERRLTDLSKDKQYLLVHLI